MATAYTPNLDLNLPEVGASRDTWGALVNQNFSALDQFVGMAMPIGALLDYAGPTAPQGWLICDGRTVSRVTYSALFAAIGTFWGSGDGSTTFNLPTLCGRSTIGPGTVIDQAGNSYSFGFTSLQGYVNNQILQANLPAYNLVTDLQGSHNHTGPTTPAGSHAHSTDTQGGHYHPGAYFGDPNRSGYTDAQGNHLHNVPLTLAGGGVSFAAGSFAVGGNVQTDTQGQHSHNVTVNGAGNVGLAIPTDGWHAHTTTSIGDHVHYIYWDGQHQHNVNLGGGGVTFEVLNPVAVVTKLIYAGEQAAAMVAVTVATTTTTIEGRDELAVLRAELDELRAQMQAVFAPVRQHRLAAPIRGPH